MGADVPIWVLVVAAGLIAVLATRPPASVAEVQSPLVGNPAPSVGGVTLTGTRYELPREPGMYVVVNFFASWAASVSPQPQPHQQPPCIMVAATPATSQAIPASPIFTPGQWASPTRRFYSLKGARARQS